MDDVNVCRVCQKPVPLVNKGNGQQRKFCSTKCRESRISNGTVGAIHELLVCADLLKKRYSVFRAVSPSCSCDLIAMRDNKILRVQVTTAQYSQVTPGKIWFPPHDPDDYDILALVFESGEVRYLPDL